MLEARLFVETLNIINSIFYKGLTFNLCLISRPLYQNNSDPSWFYISYIMYQCDSDIGLSVCDWNIRHDGLVCYYSSKIAKMDAYRWKTLKQRLCQCAVSVKMIMKPCLSFSFNVGWQRIFGVNFVIFWASILIILRQAIFFKVFDQGWIPYFKELILVAITNIIWTIWHDRITIKFKYKKSQLLKLINWSSKKKKKINNLIIFSTFLSGGMSKSYFYISFDQKVLNSIFFCPSSLEKETLLSFWFSDWYPPPPNGLINCNPIYWLKILRKWFILYRTKS